jgi:hypothetical protein
MGRTNIVVKTHKREHGFFIVEAIKPHIVVKSYCSEVNA